MSNPSTSDWDAQLARAFKADDGPRIAPVIWRGEVVTLEELPLASLEALLKDAHELLARRQARQCDGLQRDMAMLAKSAGLSADELKVLMGA